MIREPTKRQAPPRPIPIESAKKIAQMYGYDQVVIIARKVGENGGEHCTTYGVDKENCDVAARIGNFLKFKVMKWESKVNSSAATPGYKTLTQCQVYGCREEGIDRLQVNTDTQLSKALLVIFCEKHAKELEVQS